MHFYSFSAANTLRRRWLLLALGLAATGRLFARDDEGPVQTLASVVINETPLAASHEASPQTVEAISGTRAAETINVLDTEDVVKYFPSLFLRKRNPGDTQPVMATRTWGVNSSARSLVYADGVLLTALIANNNTIGAPRWGLVAPAEIERVEVRYGPFSAADPGNAMGAVVDIVTRMPRTFEAGLTQTEAWQTFGLYDTHGTYRTDQTAVYAGNRAGKLSVWVSGNFQNSYSQPLSFVTAGAFPVGTTGGYAAQNKLGQPADVLGASGLLHTEMANAKLKLGYEFSPWLQALYTFGYWRNAAEARAETYLRDAAGQPTYAGQSGFASGTYRLRQEHSAHSLTLRSDPHGEWDWSATGSLYRVDRDEQRNAATAAAAGTTLAPAGKVARLDGTGWSTLDLKATWRPDGTGHELSLGAHRDAYTLLNPTVNVADWQPGGPATSLASEGDGKTRTEALWLQDAWSFGPDWKVTLGARSEAWKAYDGYNVSGAVAVRQPVVSASGFSPKAALAWTPTPGWTATASFGEAYRYPTAGELYQLISTGTTFTAPNPNLQPEHVYSLELKLERAFSEGRGRARVSFFQEDVKHALVAQYAPLAAGFATLYQYVMNVDRVRARGIEAVVERNDVLVRGLALSGSATWVDDRILANAGQGQSGGSTIGKRMPYVPEWRFTAVATYRPSARWALTAAGRYSGAQYSTVDNLDVNPNVYGGFATFFVADLHTHWQVDRHWAADAGVDNLFNRKYFLFHPFTQRTFSVAVKYGW